MRLRLHLGNDSKQFRPEHTLSSLRFQDRNKETRRRRWTNLISFLWLLPPCSVIQLQMLQLPLLVRMRRRRPFRDEAPAALSNTSLKNLTFQAERSFLHTSPRPPASSVMAPSAQRHWTRSAQAASITASFHGATVLILFPSSQ